MRLKQEAECIDSLRRAIGLKSCHVQISSKLCDTKQPHSHFDDLPTSVQSISVRVCAYAFVCASFEQLPPMVCDTAQPLWPLGHIHFDFFVLERKEGIRPMCRTTDHLWSERVNQVVSSWLVNYGALWDLKEGKMRRNYNLVKALISVLSVKFWSLCLFES